MSTSLLSLLIEPLEARIAPAILFTFTDVDGDLATVKISKGQPADVTFFLDAGQLQTVDLTDPVFTGANVTITAKPVAGLGDGRVNVGYINAMGVSLGNVTVAGDLGHINAGVGTAAFAVKSLSVDSIGAFGITTQAPGGNLGSSLQGSVAKLKVIGDIADANIGFSGVPELKVGSISIGGSLDGGQLFLEGALGSLKIGGSVLGSDASLSGAILGRTIGSVTVGGSLAAGGGAMSGALQADSIGSVKIGGSLIGGAGDFGGEVLVTGRVGSFSLLGSIIGTGAAKSGLVQIGDGCGSVRIGGSLEGGAGVNSGRLQISGAVGSLFIGGSVLGGDGGASGSIEGFAKLGSGIVRGNVEGGDGAISGRIGFGFATHFAVGGSVIGGDGNFSGKVAGNAKNFLVGGSLLGGAGQGSGVLSPGQASTLKIAGDLVGGSTTAAGQVLDSSGGILVDGNTGPKAIIIGGSIFAGTEFPGSSLVASGAIKSTGSLGAISVRGSIVGSETTPVVISAEGQAQPGPTTDLAIKSISVGGTVARTSVLGGYNFQGMPVNADAQIGAVNVGTWQESNLVAGVAVGGDLVFGTDDDVKIAGGNDAIQSRIASFIVRGQAIGSVAAGGYFGVVAQQIGSVKIAGLALPFTAAPNEVFRLGGTDGTMGDFFAREDV